MGLGAGSNKLAELPGFTDKLEISVSTDEMGTAPSVLPTMPTPHNKSPNWMLVGWRQMPQAVNFA